MPDGMAGEMDPRCPNPGIRQLLRNWSNLITVLCIDFNILLIPAQDLRLEIPAANPKVIKSN